MRALVLIAIVAVGVFGYLAWFGDDDATTDANQIDPANSADPLSEVADKVPDKPKPPAEGELEVLSRRVEERPGKDGDADRIRLAQILLQEPVPDTTRIDTLLHAVLDHNSDHTPTAAVLLMRKGSTNAIRLRGATYLREEVKDSPELFAESTAFLAHDLVDSPEDSKQVRAWELLSESYFASDNPEWRGSLRPKLQRIVDKLVLEPRMTTAFEQYTVKPLDNLAKIAKKHGTTADALRWINRLEGDLIHPGDRLKIFSGTVSIEIDKSEFRLDARVDGKFLMSTKVGLGKFDKTPVGEFEIALKQEHPAWHRRGQPAIPYGHEDNPLGERWLGFKNTPELQGFGIHGTSEPESIGTESSAGCVRMQNDEVVMLYRLVPVGTKVKIRE